MSRGESTRAAPPATRWLQLLFGIVCMVAIANLQYGWTLFVHPIHAKHGWSRPAIQVAFTILILAETWLVPIEGWFVDRFGPRITVLFGGVFVAAGWVTNSVADTLLLLYIGAALGGIGVAAEASSTCASTPRVRRATAAACAAKYDEPMPSSTTRRAPSRSMPACGCSAAYVSSSVASAAGSARMSAWKAG